MRVWRPRGVKLVERHFKFPHKGRVCVFFGRKTGGGCFSDLGVFSRRNTNTSEKKGRFYNIRSRKTQTLVEKNANTGVFRLCFSYIRSGLNLLKFTLKS